VRVPGTIARSLQAGKTLGFACEPDGTVREWRQFNGYFPPLGYLPWRVLEVGNGDTYGYYWPVGYEEHDPLVCTTEHDVFRVVPLASDLGGCLRLLAATRSAIAGEVREVARQFEVSLSQVRSSASSSPELSLATLDPHSPELLLAQGREALRVGDLALCEQCAREALALLPEYGSALELLSQLYRRQGRLAESAQALLDVICAPLCFGRGYEARLKSLRALQSLPDELVSGDDVFWRQRRSLTFHTGVKENDDLLLYEEAIAAYLAAGHGRRAIWLRMLVGELLSLETVSFQGRYGWTLEKHQVALTRDLVAAGFSARLPMLGIVG
jgi:hypothetical protein